jgi:hypothetical protein
MSDSQSLIEACRPLLFPTPSESDLRGLNRFGTVREYPADATLVAIGQPSNELLLR